MKISIKQLMLTSVLSFVFTLPAIAADATAVNAVDATSGSSALAASQSGVNSSIRSGVVGVGNNQGDVNNTTATTTATNQGQYQGNTGYNDQGQAQKQQQLQTQNGANNGQDQGQALTVNGAGIGNNYSTNVSHAADLSKAVGMSYAPALTTTLTETCMGSTSVGAGFSGGAFSFGTTWRDHACVRRLDAREIKSFGDIQAAKEIMCDSDLVREAFKRVGRPCAEDGGTYVAVSQPAPVAEPTPVEAPAATEVKVHDEQDSNAQHDAMVLQKAEEARAAMRANKGF